MALAGRQLQKSGAGSTGRFSPPRRWWRAFLRRPPARLGGRLRRRHCRREGSGPARAARLPQSCKAGVK
ncbi:MAG: hypothetical protein ACK56I_05450, partial [bacterium]